MSRQVNVENSYIHSTNIRIQPALSFRSSFFKISLMPHDNSTIKTVFTLVFDHSDDFIVHWHWTINKFIVIVCFPVKVMRIMLSLNCASCSFAGESECVSDAYGFDYKGSIAKAVSSAACQRWDAVPSNFTASNFPEQTISETGNRCRNPDFSPYGPWCYIHPGVREPCALVYCRK